MSEMVDYSLIVLVGLVISVVIIGRARFFRVGGLAALYLFILVATYLIRPVLSAAYDGLSALYSLDVYFPAVADSVAIGTAVALVSFAAGFRLVSPVTWQLGREDGEMPPVSSFNAVRAGRWALVGIGVGYAALLLFQDNPFTGSRGIEMEYVIDVSVFTNTTGYLTNANFVILPYAILLYSVTHRIRAVLLLSVPFLVSRAWLGWQRLIMMEFSISLLFAWILGSRLYRALSRRQILVLVALLMLILVLVTLINQDRYYFRSILAGAQSDALATPESMVQTWVSSVANPVSGFEGTAYMFQFCPRYVPRGYGRTILYTWFIKPIPRLLWRSKPIRYDLLGWTDPNLWGKGMVQGSLGDAYWNFGWPGVILMFLSTGLMLGLAERLFAASSANPFVLTGYAGFASYIFMMGRNSVFELLPQWLLYWFLPLLLVYLVSRDRTQSSRVDRLTSTGTFMGSALHPLAED